MNRIRDEINRWGITKDLKKANDNLQDSLADQAARDVLEDEDVRVLKTIMSKEGREAFERQLREILDSRANTAGRLFRGVKKRSQNDTIARILERLDSESTSEPPSSTITPENKIVFQTIKENQIGKGSGGTRVFKGTFGKNPVAVKQVSDFNCLVEAQEVMDLLSKLKGHPKVLRIFAWEVRNDSILMALELANVSLEEWVFKKEVIFPANMAPIKVLLQITEGLGYLHENMVVHRDLKPSNILLVVEAEDQVVVKIADFGITQLLAPGRKTRTIASFVGTSGWTAPELLKLTASFLKRKAVEGDADNRATLTNKIDIFSLGCVFYFVLSNGEHPFGEEDQDYYIKKAKDQIDSRKLPSLEIICNLNLIRDMISQNPEERPSCSEILQDPMFWPFEKHVELLENVNRFVEEAIAEILGGGGTPDLGNFYDKFCQKNGKCVEILQLAYRNDNFCQASEKGWIERADQVVTKVLKENRRNERSYQEVVKLVDLIQSVSKSLNELPGSVQRAADKEKYEFVKYWLERFSVLVMHVFLLKVSPFRMNPNSDAGTVSNLNN